MVGDVLEEDHQEVVGGLLDAWVRQLLDDVHLGHRPTKANRRRTARSRIAMLRSA